MTRHVHPCSQPSFVTALSPPRCTFRAVSEGRTHITHSVLPFKITAQPKSVRKAYANFVKEYGQEEGTRIFLAKAEEQGIGSTMRQRVLSVYKKGGHLHG